MRHCPGVAPVDHGPLRTHLGSFELTNYPGASRLTIGANIPTPLKVIRVGGFGSVALYDCGTPYTPPARQLTPAEAEAAKGAALKKKEATQAATLKFHRALAEKRDARSQYQMGLHYLKGEGVEADATRAKDYFFQAATQGNEDAKAELEKMAKSKP